MTNRELAKYGMRLGAYDGARCRRFVLFICEGTIEWRNEFDTKRERDAYALACVEGRKAARAQ